MNKLYKYLLFDISIEQETYGVQKLTPYAFYAICENQIKVKPILRPFEDLVKELPLTKAAAEMIGMKEGELINSLEMLFRYNNKLTGFEFTNVNVTKIKDSFVIDLNTETKNVKIDVDIELYSNFNFAINSTAWQKKENYRVGSCYYTINPNCFDFLRAMHFAVDFEEEEFIILIN